MKQTDTKKPNLVNYNSKAYKESLARQAAANQNDQEWQLRRDIATKRSLEIEAMEAKLGFDDSKTRVKQTIVHTLSSNAFTRPEDRFYVSEAGLK
jgi:hypothetical protein